MDGFQDKSKLQYYLYELIGTAILSMMFNLSEVDASALGDGIIAGVLFLLTFIAWEAGAAHFNMALTLGSFMYSTTDTMQLVENLVPCLLTMFS